MVKKVKFPLDMGNEVKVRSIEELKENYNAEKVTEYFLNGKLLTWLEDRYYGEEAEQVRELSEQSDNNPAAKLGAIFGIETKEEIDIEALEIRREKLEKLRKITADDKILENVDITALSQEDLGDLLDAEAKVIYLCGENFRIPLNVKNVKYVGINNPVVSISGNDKIDLKANGIVIKSCEFSEDTKKRMAKNADEDIPYTDRKFFNFFDENGLLCICSYTGKFNIIKIPDDVEIICDKTFYDYAGDRHLKRVIIPESVEIIGESAFGNCINLTDVNIPENVKVIGIGAFANCKKLKSLTIPDDIYAVGCDAFRDCREIEVTYRGKTYTYEQLDLLSKKINRKMVWLKESLIALGLKRY